MDKAVQDQDFLKAAGLKNSIAKAKLVQFIYVFSVGLLGGLLTKSGALIKANSLFYFL